MIPNKISIIVPAYNIQDYIERCITSIQNQTYHDIEIVIVDDGSTDMTPHIVDQLSKNDNRIKVIHCENGGVTRARLTGIRNASGEWIGFVDGDDFVEVDMYEHLLKNAMQYNATISHCGYKMVFPSHTDYYYNTGRIVEQDNMNGIKDLISGEFVEPGLWNKLYHSSLFDELLADSRIDLSIKNYEDLLMNFYLFYKSNRAIYEDVCLYHYILRLGSATTSSLNIHRLEDPLRVYKLIKEETKGIKELQDLCDQKILAILIDIVTLNLKEQNNEIRQYRLKARRELQMNLVTYLRSNVSLKYKFICLWTSMWPYSFYLVRTFISKLKGTDKKYKVE